MAKKRNPEDYCPHCGRRLRPTPEEFLGVRTALGLTQRQIASALGVKASHIAYIENGHRNPSLGMVQRWLGVLRKAAPKAAQRNKRTGATIDRMLKTYGGMKA